MRDRPGAAEPAGPWRELGRTDLTARVPADRPTAYVSGLPERCA